MRALRALVTAALLLCSLVAVTPAGADPALPYTEGPDVPATGAPAATVRAFDDERFSYTEGTRHRAIAIPAVPEGDADGVWDRVVLTLSGRTDGDPWDRLFVFGVGGVELVRGTTPRTSFTITKDVTEYASIFASGERTIASLTFGTWVGAQHVTVDLDFHSGESTVVRPAVDRVTPAFYVRGLGGDGATTSTVVQFPATAPTSAVLEVGMSGHTQAGEFWYEDGQFRSFSITVDGREIATVTPMPYVYALIGTQGTNGDNGPVWWSAHRALDIAGVHTGVGVVPPYRATLDAEEVALLRGARTVEIRQTAGGYWPTSISFLLDGVPVDAAPIGATPVDATAVRDGGLIADGDPLLLTFDRPVTCSGADPAQLTYRVGEADPVAATSLSCDGSAVVRVTLPDGAAHELSHGVITYTAAGDGAQIVAGDGPAASGVGEPVLVTASPTPFLTGAGATVEPGPDDDIVHVSYSQDVQCALTAGSGFTFAGQTARYAECDDSSTVVLSFPPGTVDGQPEDRVLRATGAGISSLDGSAVTTPDEEAVLLNVPS